MRQLFLTFMTCFMLILVSACSDHGHSHDDESHSPDAPQHDKLTN